MKRLLLLILVTGVAAPVLAQERNKGTVTVEVLAASTKEWSNPYTIPGSPGTTQTYCSGDDYSVNCTSQTVGRTADTHGTWAHRLVTASIKMPDGSAVVASCHMAFRWDFCPEPSAGQYQAKIGEHDIRLFISVQKKRPKYNADGTLKKPAEYVTREAKFKLR